MTKFKEYLNEVSTADATRMEGVIVDLWNGVPVMYKELEDAGQQTVDFLKNKGLSGKASHMGSGSVSITDNWKKWGGTDGTPKTDLIIGDRRISLKKIGGSQLMSAKKGEATATVYAALERANFNTAPVVNTIEGYLNRFIEGRSQLNISAQKKAGTVSKDILDAEKMHKEFQAYLRKILNEDKNLKMCIVYEAMTGTAKFGERSIGRASDILVFDPSGKRTNIHNTDDQSFIAEKAAKTRLSIGWKSTSSTTKARGKEYSYFSAFRLSEEIDNRIQEEIDNYDGQLITEGIVSGIIDKVTSWFSNVWNRIKDWLYQSFENILSFFNLEPEVAMSDTQF